MERESTRNWSRPPSLTRLRQRFKRPSLLLWTPKTKNLKLKKWMFMRWGVSTRTANSSIHYFAAFDRVVYSNNPAKSFKRPKYPQTKLSPRSDTIICPSFSWPKIEEFWPIRKGFHTCNKTGTTCKGTKNRPEHGAIPWLPFCLGSRIVLKDVLGLISDNNSVRPCYGEEEDLRWRSPTVSHWPGLANNKKNLQCIFGRDYQWSIFDQFLQISGTYFTYRSTVTPGTNMYRGEFQDVKKSKKYVNDHTCPPTQWEKEIDEMEMPLTIFFNEDRECKNFPLVVLTAQYQAIDQMVPLNRNPV